MKVKLPKPEQKLVVPLATEVVEALADKMPEGYRALVVLAAGTGLRQWECFGLTVDRVDFLRRQLRVDRQIVLMPRKGPVLRAAEDEGQLPDDPPGPGRR